MQIRRLMTLLVIVSMTAITTNASASTSNEQSVSLYSNANEGITQIPEPTAEPTAEPTVTPEITVTPEVTVTPSPMPTPTVKTKPTVAPTPTPFIPETLIKMGGTVLHKTQYYRFK